MSAPGVELIGQTELCRALALSTERGRQLRRRRDAWEHRPPAGVSVLPWPRPDWRSERGEEVYSLEAVRVWAEMAGRELHLELIRP